MDEIAAMAGDNPDSGLDYALYDELKPSLATFGKDGKMMMLSNPKGPIGLLYDLHENRQEDPTTLVMRLPTWLANPNIAKDMLENEKKKNPTEFQMQYGAEFGASSSDPMFTQESIQRMFSSMSMVRRQERPTEMFEYFCHLDPARTSDYYAVAVAHTENMQGVYGPDQRVGSTPPPAKWTGQAAGHGRSRRRSASSVPGAAWVGARFLVHNRRGDGWGSARCARPAGATSCDC